MAPLFTELTKEEKGIFEKLNTPQKIQDFLETLPINFEEKGETLYSPRSVLKKKKAHCFEGALFAGAVLLYQHKATLLLDLQTTLNDEAHVVALFKQNRKWGAISKTNHASLRYRDPVYKTIRELAMSYFNEYFKDSGQKTLRSYATLDLKKIKKNWVIDENNLWYVDKMFDTQKHTALITNRDVRNLRKVGKLERKTGKFVDWKKRKGV